MHLNFNFRYNLSSYYCIFNFSDIFIFEMGYEYEIYIFLSINEKYHTQNILFAIFSYQILLISSLTEEAVLLILHRKIVFKYFF